jgi:thiamine biosynthesis lipoprotein ApbE
MSTTLANRQDAADWTALGCAVRVVVRRPADLATAREVVAEELDAIDLACSRFRPDSELSLLAGSRGQRRTVSPLFAEAIATALDAAVTSGGDLDPTVGSAMNEVGYDRDFAQLDLDGAAITIVRRAAPGWQCVELDRVNGWVRVPDGIRLDLGATAKALAADRAAGRLAEVLDGRGALVGLGGDIRVTGHAPQGGWSVRVQDVTGPVGEVAHGPVQLVGMHSGGLATSSTTARRWVRGGQVMHHILDPRSGVPVASPWRTVSVAAPTCVAANVASTATIVRGEAAVGWLTRRGLAARLVRGDGSVVTLPGWPADAGADR